MLKLCTPRGLSLIDSLLVDHKAITKPERHQMVCRSKSCWAVNLEDEREGLVQHILKQAFIMRNMRNTVVGWRPAGERKADPDCKFHITPGCMFHQPYDDVCGRLPASCISRFDRCQLTCLGPAFVFGNDGVTVIETNFGASVKDIMKFPSPSRHFGLETDCITAPVDAVFCRPPRRG